MSGHMLIPLSLLYPTTYPNTIPLFPFQSHFPLLNPTIIISIPLFAHQSHFFGRILIIPLLLFSYILCPSCVLELFRHIIGVEAARKWKECGGFEEFVIACQSNCYIKSKRTISHVTFSRIYQYMIHSIFCRTGPKEFPQSATSVTFKRDREDPKLAFAVVDAVFNFQIYYLYALDGRGLVSNCCTASDILSPVVPEIGQKHSASMWSIKCNFKPKC